MPPMVSPALTQASLASQTPNSKSKGKLHVSFTDWVLGGSLLSINSSPNVSAATRARSDSRIRATAGKDKNGRSVVILEDRDQDGLVGGEVEMLVVRKVGRKGGGGGRSRSASAGSNVTVKAKISEEVLETVVEESGTVEKKETVEAKKSEDADGKGEHALTLQKEEEGKKVEEKKSEKAEEPTADIVPKTAAAPSVEDKEKDKKPEAEVVVVEVEVKDNDKDKEKKKDKDAKKASKGEDGPENTKIEEPSADATATAPKETTESTSEKPTEVKEDDKGGKVEPADQNEWTKEQDEKLMAMKKENKTWKDIAGELGTGKKEVVARYKVLQEQEKTEDEQEDEEPKPKKPEKKKNIKCAAQVDKNEDTEEEIYISPDCPYHHPKPKSSAPSSKQDKKKKRKSYGELDRDRDDEEEDNGERMWGNKNEYGRGNEQGRLRPDKIWSAEDCETLDYLMEKHRSTQWLQLQAGFFNYTGRMVKAEFIERKFRKDGLA
ncbi:57bf544c-e85d-4493-9378-b04f72b33b09 [Sclerotinia trifoliorum]|uniref:57bf544c-e85d-4493-9378-b04f72b33b09 n=1 Tax=Sclerotinia trifoliorum TaxID=28548 RepID=A0A8H2ZJD2_9HELO|nr:57bf544c-e85d-4493-9378-b04f72b33b09 [Sclerotinia trifoliorum]